jgi:hypothetical protein
MLRRKSKGRKRHVDTDTTGLLVGTQVDAADVQDRVIRQSLSPPFTTFSCGCSISSSTALMPSTSS